MNDPYLSLKFHTRIHGTTYLSLCMVNLIPISHQLNRKYGIKCTYYLVSTVCMNHIIWPVSLSL